MKVEDMQTLLDYLGTDLQISSVQVHNDVLGTCVHVRIMLK